jgi:outer membrane receptor protein involved in Fe transport
VTRAALERSALLCCLCGSHVAGAQAKQTLDAAPAPVVAAMPPSASGAAVSSGESPAPKEVIVRGASSSERLRRSAHAVDVVELGRARHSAADLGEALARQSSLRVQREGGLGSMGRYGLNGLSGDRVRFFLNGVPLELTAYQMGVANVPVGLVERVELFQGVVPIRFGADALGGAVNLVTDEAVQASRASASYELASFDTHRLAAAGRIYSSKLRAFARLSAFVDTSANDYPVDVEVFDESGQVSTDTVRRFHDGYRGVGATLAAGVVQRDWVDRLVAQAYVADYDRDVQHNTGMTVPYGEVTYARSALGGSVSYRKRLARVWRIDAQLGYAVRRSRFLDVSRCRYDWYGRCFVELPLAGEIDSLPLDQNVDERTGYARFDLSVMPLNGHMLSLSLSPTFTSRRGHDEQIAADEHDPLRARRTLLSGVVGLEYEVTHGPLAVCTFAKQYVQDARSQERLPSGGSRKIRMNTPYFGAGDALRVTLWPGAYVKGSFEQAVRLPAVDERFGDGGLIADNLELEPETSQNVNLGAYLEPAETALGAFRAQLTGSGRRIESMVVLLSTGSYYRYTNVLNARALGTEASLGWSSPAELLGARVSFSYQDVRNTSSTGPGALFEGDRIPNQPFLQIAGSAFARLQRVASAADSLELSWDVRHVRRFYRGWESAGAAGVKLDVPSQTVHALALSHVSPSPHATLVNSFEVQNLTDEKAFDFYGAERPGRSFHWKISLEYQ